MQCRINEAGIHYWWIFKVYANLFYYVVFMLKFIQYVLSVSENMYLFISSLSSTLYHHFCVNLKYDLIKLTNMEVDIFIIITLHSRHFYWSAFVVCSKLLTLTV